MKNRNKHLGIIHFLSVIMLLALPACAANNQETGRGIQWLPFVLAIVLLGAAAYGIYWLISNGKWQQWRDAGINHSKWNIQEGKLKGELEDLKQKQSDLIDALGKQAWEERISHPDYSTPYYQLEILDQQVKVLQEDAAALESNLQKAKDSREKVDDDYDRQLKRLDSVLKDAQSNLEKSHSKQNDLEKQLGKLDREKIKLDEEIKQKDQKRVELQASDLPDKQKKIDSLNGSISALEKSLLAAVEREPVLKTEITNQVAQQTPLMDELARLEEQVSRVKAEQQTALEPLDKQIGELEEKLTTKKTNLEDLQTQMATHLKSLGPLVNSVRPESGELAGAYYKIDLANNELDAKTKEHQLITQQLEESDKGAVRNFWITLGVLLLVLILIIVMLSLAF